jgi:hypothetical protein
MGQCARVLTDLFIIATIVYSFRVRLSPESQLLL